MNKYIIPVLIIALPGIIGVKLYKSLRNIGPRQKKLKDWQDFVEIFLFTIFSYAIYFSIIYLINVILKKNIQVSNIEIFFKNDIRFDDLS